MKTIIYFDTLRNRKKFFVYIVIPLIVLVAVFFVFTILDKCFPEFNVTYMKWPDIVKGLLGLSAWNSHLAVNVWQILSLIYPFYIIYVLMSGLCSSVIQEERLETIVYLNNAGVDNRTFFISKTIIWIAGAFLATMSLLIVNSVLLLLIGAARNIIFIINYYLGLFLICIFYLSIALFMSSYKKHEEECKDTIVTILLLPWMISRIPAVLRMFSLILELTGREGKVADVLMMLGERLHPLEMVAPVTWCLTSVNVTWIYMICILLIFLIMNTSALLIYEKRHDMMVIR
ncbi:MAG: hypothetical protein K2I10_13240 [Lachnospiraceae bacterium]|nr:hypothetical protein [Lachnospiraceae bacterium]